MKRIMSLMLASAFVFAALLSGCGSSASSEAPSAPPEAPSAAPSEAAPAETAAAKGPIAIIVPSADHGWMAGLAYFAEQKCKEMGLEEGTGYKLVTSSNVNEQANQIQEMVDLGVAAIVLNPHNNEVSVAAKKITDAGIPLVVFDRKVDGDYTAYVAGDNEAMGVLSAEYLGEKLGGKGAVAVMNTPSVGSISTERVGGFKKGMEKYPDIQLIDVTSAGFTQEDGLKMATDMLTANPQIDAIFSIDDEPSLGILQAIKDAGRTDVKYLSGGGGAQAYFKKIGSEADINLFTATYSPAMIKDAIQAAQDILDGKTVEKDTIIPPTVVDKDNVSGFLDESSPY